MLAPVEDAVEEPWVEIALYSCTVWPTLIAGKKGLGAGGEASSLVLHGDSDGVSLASGEGRGTSR